MSKFNKNKNSMSHPVFIHYGRTSTKKISEVLNVNTEDYENRNIFELPLSRDVEQFVYINKIKTYSDILNMTFSELKSLVDKNYIVGLELIGKCLTICAPSLSLKKNYQNIKNKAEIGSPVLRNLQETTSNEIIHSSQNIEKIEPLTADTSIFSVNFNSKMTIADVLKVNPLDFSTISIERNQFRKPTRTFLSKHQVKNYSDLLSYRINELGTAGLSENAITKILNNCNKTIKDYRVNNKQLSNNFTIGVKPYSISEDLNIDDLTQHYNDNSKEKISTILQVGNVDYRISVAKTKLSQEAEACLANRRIFLYSQLLDFTFEELASWSDCTKSTAIELLRNCKEITSHYRPANSAVVLQSEVSFSLSENSKSEVQMNQKPLSQENDSCHSVNSLLENRDKCLTKSLPNTSTIQVGAAEEGQQTKLENNLDIFSLMALYESNSPESIGKALSINDLEYFDTIDIFKNSKFSVRTANCIKTQKIKTYGELFRLSFRNIKDWRNLGKKSASELLNQCLIISKRHQSYSFSIISALMQDLLSYCQQCTIEEDRIEVISSLLKILPETYGKRDTITSYIDNFYLKEKNTEDLINEVKKSGTIKDKYIGPFISAYERCYPEAKIKLEVNDTSTFENYSFPLEDQMINSFLKWAAQDINTYSLDTFFCVKETKKLSILKAIANGETLESIGNVQGITRERVRQIYKKSIAKIKSNISYDSLFYWLYAYNKAESIIEIDSFQDLIREDNRNLFIPILKRGDLDKEGDWHYEKKYNALVFDFIGDNIVRSLEKEISFLPSEINNDDMDSHILQIQEKLGCKLAFILKEIESKFFKYKYFYSRKKYNFKDMCLYIVREHFPNGIHISEKEDYDKLCNFLTDLFDFDSTGYSDAHVKNVINETCTLCGEGTYKPKIQVSEKNNNIIRNFIEYSFSLGRTALYFNEIFIKLGKDLDTALIENQYVLHDIISDLNLPYEITRNYIKKEANSNIVDDITFYVRENWPITKDKVINYFCMSDTQFNQLLCKCSKIKLRGKMLVYQSQISDSKS